MIEIEENSKLTEVPDEAKMCLDTENAAAIALLKSWREQDASDDPEELLKAEAELIEFKRNMNTNRLVTGERLVYP